MPVTASYIICAVIAAPAMIKLGVPDYAAHMFIFYYSVLSEVSPPTALSPFAAAAITGGGARLGAAQDDPGRAAAVGAGGPFSGISEPAGGVDGGRDRP